MKVLIDEDIFIQLSKQLEAEKAGYELDCYFNSDEFLATSRKYTEDIAIYINSNFEMNLSIDKITEQGFKNIYPISELHWS